MAEFVDLTSENIDFEHLCCIIRTKKSHAGVEKKRGWLRDRLKEGHVFRKLNVDGCVFIEYAPLESAWTPISGRNYMYIYCLWVLGAPRGHGYGRLLMQSCIDDAKKRGMAGVCMLGAKKQKSWLSDQAFAKKFGFSCVDETSYGYELLALRFDGADGADGETPQFTERARAGVSGGKGLEVYYDAQCPYIPDRVNKLEEYCGARGIEAKFCEVDRLQAAKELPCVFNNWAAFWNGKFATVNQLDGAALERIMKRGGEA